MRIHRLLDILKDLAAIREYALLNLEDFAFETTLQGSNRMLK